MRAPTVAALLVGALGVLFIVTSFILRAAVDPESTVAAEAAVPVVDAPTLAKAERGARVLLEATIARDAAAGLDDLVVARQWKSLGTPSPTSNAPGPKTTPSEQWKLVRTVEPPLTLDANGPLTLAAYEVTAPCVSRTTDGVFAERLRTEGFRAGDALVVIGAAAPPGLSLARLRCGTRAQYLESVREDAGIPRFLATVFSIVGALALAVAAVIVLVTRRSR